MPRELEWLLEALKVILLAVAVLLIAGGIRPWAIARRQWRESLELEFRALRRQSANPRGSFDGARAQIILELATNHGWYFQRGPNGDAGEGVYRICKNEHGEYFLYVSGTPPQLTHLSQKRARNALRYDPETYRREFGCDP